FNRSVFCDLSYMLLVGFGQALSHLRGFSTLAKSRVKVTRLLGFPGMIGVAEKASRWTWYTQDAEGEDCIGCGAAYFFSDVEDASGFKRLAGDGLCRLDTGDIDRGDAGHGRS